jgi:hypothetical protein
MECWNNDRWCSMSFGDVHWRCSAPQELPGGPNECESNGGINH